MFMRKMMTMREKLSMKKRNLSGSIGFENMAEEVKS